MCLAGHQPADHRLSHDALLYRTEDDLVREVGQFVEAGQTRGEPVFLAFAGPKLNTLRDALPAGDGVRFEDIGELAANPARLLPLLREWVDDHQGPVRIVGEVMWPGRDPEVAAEVIRHEALVNLALGDAPVTARCAYNAALPPAVLSGVERSHHRIVEAGDGARTSASFTEPRELWENPTLPLTEPDHPEELPVTENLAQLRHRVQASEVLAPLDGERTPDLVLAISEAAANALRYDRPPRTLRLWRSGDRVVAEVSGQGRVEDPLSGRRRPCARASRGWGLWVINQVCDLVELRQHGGRVRLRMHMRC